MIMFLTVLSLIALAMAMLSLGLVLGGRRLSGSCGGLGSGSCPCSKEQQVSCPRRRGGSQVGHDPLAPRRKTPHD